MLLVSLFAALSTAVLAYWWAFRHVKPSRAEREVTRTTDLDPLLLRSGVALAKLIREEEVTSEAAVRAFIAQQKRVNPLLNSVVDTRYAEAIEEAREADGVVRACRSASERAALPPLLGVPISVKECFAVTGMSNTAGSVRRAGKPATEDATAVARLRRAGAIVLGVTNTSELCMWMESANPVFGRTSNPYNTRHTVGGSSGGEGCIVSACGAPFGLGSDVGGSIRMPAFFNGCFGHKPTGGLVPGTGQYPNSDPGEAERFLTTGPIARHAEDLFPVLQILAGPDGSDTGCIPMELGDPMSIDLSKITVLNWPHPRVALGPPSRCLRVAQSRAFAHLRSVCDAELSREISLDKMKHALDIWSNMLQDAQTTPFTELLDTSGVEFKNVFRWMAGRSDNTLPAIGLSILEKVTKAMPARQKRFVKLGHELREEIVELLSTDDEMNDRYAVILFPSYSQTAPVHHQAIFPPINYAYQCIWNTMKNPVTQVPLGLSEDTGLPTGLQVVGLHGEDAVTIRVAIELERQFGGWSHREELY
jgi:fatty acid amide hydrolase 2